MSDDTKDRNSNANDTFDLDEFFENFDFEAAQEKLDHDTAQPKKPSSKQAVSLDATMSYEAVGEQMPELPFADERNNDTAAVLKPEKKTAGSKPKSTRTRTGRKNRPTAPVEAPESASLNLFSEPDLSDDFAEAEQILKASRNGADKEPDSSDTHAQSQDLRESGISRAPAESVTAAAFSQKKRRLSNADRRAAMAPLAFGPDSDSSQLGSYRALDKKSSTYRIRGGGTIRLKSPIFFVIYILIVIIGLGGISYGLYYTIDSFLHTETTGPIVLTPEQTRSAIDNEMPILLNILGADFKEITQAFDEQGYVIFQDKRYVPDAIDPNATKLGLIHVPRQVTDDFISGFYEGMYNAYSTAELQESFNGAWVLDMVSGEAGSLFKVKYMNLNVGSIKDEMDHLADIQGLSGEGVAIVDSGTDNRGNTVVQGTKAVGDVVYYWKIAACPFNEVYIVERIPDNAVYISCTVADYDFYTGGDEIK